MKKVIAICAAGLFLASCGTKTIVVEKSPDSTPAPAITQPPVKESPVQSYMDNIASEYPYEVARMGEKIIVEFGYTVCDAIDEGLTVEGLTVMAIQNDVDVEFIGFLTGAAVRDLCPDNQWFVDSVN